MNREVRQEDGINSLPGRRNENRARNPAKMAGFGDHQGHRFGTPNLFEEMKTIKDMSKHSRSREKLCEKGASALTDEELVAAILGMGIAGSMV
jgi:hypothetical protein